MPSHVIPFSEFVHAAGAEHEPFIQQLHELLLQNHCVEKLKTAANGLVVSYVHKPSKRTVANYIFRKQMPMMRIYADHIAHYPQLIAHLPASMKEAITQGGDCARLINPTACNSRCLLGFDFVMDGARLQKCRCHNSFAFFLNDETKPFIRQFIEQELAQR